MNTPARVMWGSGELQKISTSWNLSQQSLVCSDLRGYISGFHFKHQNLILQTEISLFVLETLYPVRPRCPAAPRGAMCPLPSAPCCTGQCGIWGFTSDCTLSSDTRVNQLSRSWYPTGNDTIVIEPAGKVPNCTDSDTTEMRGLL